MFTKILIANRGEIACRIIRTARNMSIRTVAVYSDADSNALHVKQADEAVHIGPSPSSQSYLLADKVLAAAQQTGAQAIHPGYGFLSENAAFAEECQTAGIVFIGPPSAAIEVMGSKSAAKATMQAAGVPVVPGYHGDDQSPEILQAEADAMGYPVLLKAVAGGGGKGMRQVWKSEEFANALTEAKRESAASFGDDVMLIEKYLPQPRHVEVQVFCDRYGNGVYLFERDCSVQRRHQKVIEEAPAPGLPAELRQEMGETAVRAAQAINYEGAGTIEFLLDTDGSFYFMEMNTRLQVEHPVTELITGQDLVEWQLQVANGGVLPAMQSELAINGHAFEARIYAEDPGNDFMPAAGLLTTHRPPAESPYVRIDTGVAEGDEISPFYDPMIAKLVVWDEDRGRALVRLREALSQYHIAGLITNISFLGRLAASGPFVNAELDTRFIERHHELIFAEPERPETDWLPIMGLFLVLRLRSSRQLRVGEPGLWNQPSGWRLNQPAVYQFAITLDDEQYPLQIEDCGAIFRISDVLGSADSDTVAVSGLLADDSDASTTNGNFAIESATSWLLTATTNGHRQTVRIAEDGAGYVIFANTESIAFSRVLPDLGEAEASGGNNGFAAPMNGTIVETLVAAGQQVEADEALVVMEGMKMQYTIRAPSAGTVTELFCAVGELVEGGAALLAFEETESA